MFINKGKGLLSNYSCLLLYGMLPMIFIKSMGPGHTMMYMHSAWQRTMMHAHTPGIDITDTHDLYFVMIGWLILILLRLLGFG